MSLNFLSGDCDWEENIAVAKLVNVIETEKIYINGSIGRFPVEHAKHMI